MVLHISPQTAALIGEEAKEALLALAQPVVRIDVEHSTPVSISDSYIGGRPFAELGFDWPVGEASGEPMTFLCQINFAQVPPILENFPRDGMLQWFVDGADDVMGLTWEPGSNGREGLYVRYLTAEQVMQGSPNNPADPLRYDFSGMIGPLEDLRPRSLTFVASEALPHWGELYEGVNNGDLEAIAQEAMEEAQEDSSAEEELNALMMPEFSIGGRPVFVQGDPRGSKGKDRPGTLIMQLGSQHGDMMWGDMGTAQLFGDPKELAQGNTDSLWWDWACS